MWLSSSKSLLSLQSQGGYSIDRGTGHHRSKHAIYVSASESIADPLCVSIMKWMRTDPMKCPNNHTTICKHPCLTFYLPKHDFVNYCRMKWNGNFGRKVTEWLPEAESWLDWGQGTVSVSLSVSLINKITQTGAGNDPHMLLMSCSRPLAILFFRGRITRSSISNVLMLKHSWTENQHQVTVKTCQKCAGYLPAFSLWKHTENYREEFGLNLMHVWMKLICPDRCRKWVVCFPTNKLEGEYLSALQLQSAFPCTCSLWLSCLAF